MKFIAPSITECVFWEQVGLQRKGEGLNYAYAKEELEEKLGMLLLGYRAKHDRNRIFEWNFLLMKKGEYTFFPDKMSAGAAPLMSLVT